MEAILRRELVTNKTLCRIFGMSVFVILTALGAFVRIPLPFSPVPLTLQTFFVLLSGVCLGGPRGATSQLSYVFLGVLGLPIFAGAGIGLSYFLGPTGGYLLGFVIASFWLGRFIKYSLDNFLLTLCLFCIADLILLSCGIIWLKFLFGYSLTKLLFIGLIPFIPGDLLKAWGAALLYLKLKSRLKEAF